VTGKWLFPHSLVEDWVKRSAQQHTTPQPHTSKRVDLDQGLLIAGSNDMLLDSLLDLAGQRFPDYVWYTSNLGSFGGLTALKQARAHVALAHLRDQTTGEYNVPFVAQPDTPKGIVEGIVVVTLWHRRLGLVSRPGDAQVQSLASLPQHQVRFVNRQPGSGVRWLIDQQLQQAQIEPQSIPGYETQAWTHWEVGLQILHQQADIGVATQSVAHQLGLCFSEIVEERFDLLVSKDVYFTKPVQALLEVLSSSAFKDRAATLGGYDVRETGKLAYAAS
jgi:putative molybdopterin biosynthesis protein